MAHTKSGRTTKGNRNSFAKRLGVKVFGGQAVARGNIIIRQRGTKFRPGEGTMMGRDFTIFAVQPGIVEFSRRGRVQYVTVQKG